MRAIKIDPAAHTVEVIDITGDLRSLQTQVGGWIEVAHRFENGDILYVDEEGMLKDIVDWFALDGAHQPFAGPGIIVGSWQSGDTTAAVSPLARIQAIVTFIKILHRG